MEKNTSYPVLASLEVSVAVHTWLQLNFKVNSQIQRNNAKSSIQVTRFAAGNKTFVSAPAKQRCQLRHFRENVK